jgi:hypothetical protein
MDDGKQAEPQPDTDAQEKHSSIREGVSNLVGSIKTLVTDATSVIADHIKSPAEVSNRVETAVLPVEENYDAPPMTADEIAGHAAADTQPVSKAKRSRRKKAAVAKTASPKKANKRAKKANKTTAAKKGKEVAKTSVKKAAKKKTAKKMMTKKAAKKSKLSAKKTTAKKAAKKKKKSKR